MITDLAALASPRLHLLLCHVGKRKIIITDIIIGNGMAMRNLIMLGTVGLIN